jgi:hypothetical protein
MTDSAFAAAGTIPRISPTGRDDDDVSFRALRAYAIDRAQAASGQTWTDYNLHDPGVTILEAVCYALTDLVYQIDFPVADHLAGPDGEIDAARQALFPPQRIFPCRATTITDYRRVLLDQIPSLQDARLKPAEHPSGSGLFDLALLPPEDGSPSWSECVRRARAAYRRQRSLADDLATVRRIETRDYTLKLTGAVWGPRDPADVIAEIYDVCATAIAPPLIARSFEGLIEAGRSLESIFTGPAVEAGFVDESSLRGPSADPNQPDARPKDELSLNDLRTLLLQIDGVAAVTALALTPVGDGTASEDKANGGDANLLRWDGDVWQPRLRTPQPKLADGSWPAGAADIDDIRLTRSGTAVRPDAVDVVASYADIRAGRDAGRRPDTSRAGLSLPRGAPRQILAYDSLQNLLPPIYHLGRHRPPEESGMMAALAAGETPTLTGEGRSVLEEGGAENRDWGARGARVVQLKSYLSLFDQILANASAQIAHIRDLFSPEGALSQSYWRDILDDDAVPGVRALYVDETPEEVAERIYRRYDDAVDRISRMLDYLLALYGEQYVQNTQRQFLGHLDSVEQARLLLNNKAAFLRGIEALTRDRAQGFDYGVQLWGPTDRTPGLQRRLALLLGFGNPRARKLATDLSFHHARRPQGGAQDGGAPLEWPRSHPAAERAVARAMPQEAAGIAADVLFTLAVNRQSYVWRPHAEGSGGVLWLGREASNRHALGGFPDQHQAAELASRLRSHMRAMTEASEGLHLVEHILLRPRAPGRRWRAVDYALRLTLVFPNWTVRTSRPDFRNFARETAEINCPAHVAVECLWLDNDAMRRFETAFEHWMTCLRERHDSADVEELDAASRTLRRLIARELSTQRRRLRREAGDAGSS